MIERDVGGAKTPRRPAKFAVIPLMMRDPGAFVGLDPTPVVERFADLALRATGADIVAVFLPEDDHGALVCRVVRAAAGMTAQAPKAFPPIPMAQGTETLPGFAKLSSAPIESAHASVGLLVAGWVSDAAEADSAPMVRHLAQALAVALESIVDHHIELVLAHEREALAADLMETSARVLSAINLRAGLLRLVADDDLSSDARVVESLARRGLSALSRGSASIAALRPEPPDLARDVLTLARSYEARHPVTVMADVRGADSLPDHIQVAFERVVREGLSNVERHAEAQLVSISVRVEDRSAVLRVRDDGLGLRPSADPTLGVGLALICEAVESLGGRVELRDAVPGTELVARVPLRTPAASPAGV